MDGVSFDEFMETAREYLKIICRRVKDLVVACGVDADSYDFPAEATEDHRKILYKSVMWLVKEYPRLPSPELKIQRLLELIERDTLALFELEMRKI